MSNPIYQFAADTPSPSWADVSKESYDEYVSRGGWLTRIVYAVPVVENQEAVESRHAVVKALHDIMQAVPCNSLYSLAEAVLDAGYAAPAVEAVTCAQCSASTSDICNQNGCGYLESGNGAPAVESQEPVPVMKLEAERLWGGDGEYSVSFCKAGWLDECRKKGGTFFLYTSPPAPVAVVLPDNLESHRNTWIQAMERLVELEPESCAPDEDEKGLWRHELKAMRDMYADLDRFSTK